MTALIISLIMIYLKNKKAAKVAAQPVLVKKSIR
jgi:hypothetical protein